MLPGQRIKTIRTKLGISTRDVEEFSSRIAEAETNPEFHISDNWLSQIENTDAVPGIHKLYSISVICRVPFLELLSHFGLHIEKIATYQHAMPLGVTHRVPEEIHDYEKMIALPAKWNPKYSLDDTALLSHMIQLWGEVPLSLIQNLNLRHHEYGFIGLKDRTLDPLLPPGSFVRIDTQAKWSMPVRYHTEFDRPIYFLELPSGYACSWCELQDNRLVLVPHPLSPVRIREFTHEKEARIIGRVTAISMQLTRDSRSGAIARSPARP